MTKKRVFNLKLWRVAACCLLLIVMSQAAVAATLRGRLERKAPNGASFPAPGIAVTVYRADRGRSRPSFTGPNGMYYLNIPAGLYSLEIWFSRDPRAKPMVYQIKVSEPYTDIPPIFIP